MFTLTDSARTELDAFFADKEKALHLEIGCGKGFKGVYDRQTKRSETAERNPQTV